MEHGAQTKSEKYGYRIDRDSKLIELSPSWVEFARRNWDPRFDPHEVLGISLWDHISDLPTLHIFNQIINRLRVGQGRGWWRIPGRS